MYTPGPWQCDEIGSEGWTVFARIPYRTLDFARTLATNLSEEDARLIHAAPELLEALRLTLQQTVNLDSLLSRGGDRTDTLKAIAVACAAIAKAEGK